MDKAGVAPCPMSASSRSMATKIGAAFLATAAKGRIWDRESSVRTVF